MRLQIEFSRLPCKHGVGARHPTSPSAGPSLSCQEQNWACFSFPTWELCSRQQCPELRGFVSHCPQSVVAHHPVKILNEYPYTKVTHSAYWPDNAPQLTGPATDINFQPPNHQLHTHRFPRTDSRAQQITRSTTTFQSQYYVTTKVNGKYKSRSKTPQYSTLPHWHPQLRPPDFKPHPRPDSNPLNRLFRPYPYPSFKMLCEPTIKTPQQTHWNLPPLRGSWEIFVRIRYSKSSASDSRFQVCVTSNYTQTFSENRDNRRPILVRLNANKRQLRWLGALACYAFYTRCIRHCSINSSREPINNRGVVLTYGNRSSRATQTKSCSLRVFNAFITISFLPSDKVRTFHMRN